MLVSLAMAAMASINSTSLFGKSKQAYANEYMTAHRTTRCKNKGPNATKGKRQVSIKQRSNKRK